MTFADRLERSIERAKSILVAGFDPLLDNFPPFILEAAAKKKAEEESIAAALSTFYELALDALAPFICAIKPNIAFFEQYGIGGLRGFKSVCALAKERDVPVIGDIKRGDIGTTAAAYSSAFLGKPKAFGKKIEAFNVDAVTVNPFLGFETLLPFLEECKSNERGIFVLLRTSNPGAKELQGLKDPSGQSATDIIAGWLNKNAKALEGRSGLSGLGAVVGATDKSELKRLRSLLPTNFFLIPGVGAQGGTSSDARAGLTPSGKGAVVNMSRALFESTAKATNSEDLKKLLSASAEKAARELTSN